MMGHTFNPSTKEIETDLLEFKTNMIHKEFQARRPTWDPVSKKRWESRGTGEMAQWIVFATKTDHQFDS